MFEARVILDSISEDEKRLTTVVLTYPRFIHSEILTHRDRARNSASSRAIPWPTMMQRIVNEPVIPIVWGSEQKGMQTGVGVENAEECERIWLEARDHAVASAQKLADLGVHKSLCNRLTEPWMWITVVMTSTEWKNFFRLRCHPDAEIHFQRIAGMLREALDESVPRKRWVHLPFVVGYDAQDEDFLWVDSDELLQYKKVSAARCARVSYLTHERS